MVDHPGGARFSANISDPDLRTHQDAVVPHAPTCFRVSRAKQKHHRTGPPLLPPNTVQLLSALLCSVPTQVNTGLEEWRLASYWDTRVDKDHWIADPALFIPVEPLGFFGLRILNEAL